MKKIILTMFAALLISVSGWASETDTTEPQSEPDAPAIESTDSAAEPQPTPEPATEEDTPADDSASAADTDPAAADVEEEKTEHGFGHKLLFYIPNRILDVFDFVRLRLRVGPGLALGGRITKPISFFIGGYGSVYVGLPGPRMEPIVKLPVGIENYGGMSLSLLDSTNQGTFAPNYSPTEIGYSVQVLIVGADVDVDPVEVIDLALGFLFIDIRGDDL